MYMKKYIVECIGTFVLTFFGCATAMFVGCGTPAGLFATAAAFGLTVVAMAYTIGGISGCHINPAITLGVALSGRMSWKDAVGYWLGQLIGAIIAGALLLLFAKTMTPSAAFAGANPAGLGANGVAGAGGAGGAFLVEVVGTFIFVLVVLGTTDPKVGAGLAIGLSLTLVHLVCINLTGTSVNPARSIGPAIFAGGQALKDLWVFIVAPLVGGALSAVVWSAISPAITEAKAQ